MSFSRLTVIIETELPCWFETPKRTAYFSQVGSPAEGRDRLTQERPSMSADLQVLQNKLEEVLSRVQRLEEQIGAAAMVL